MEDAPQQASRFWKWMGAIAGAIVTTLLVTWAAEEPDRLVAVLSLLAATAVVYLTTVGKEWSRSRSGPTPLVRIIANLLIAILAIVIWWSDVVNGLPSWYIVAAIVSLCLTIVLLKWSSSRREVSLVQVAFGAALSLAGTGVICIGAGLSATWGDGVHAWQILLGLAAVILGGSISRGSRQLLGLASVTAAVGASPPIYDEVFPVGWVLLAGGRVAISLALLALFVFGVSQLLDLRPLARFGVFLLGGAIAATGAGMAMGFYGELSRGLSLLSIGAELVAVGILLLGLCVMGLAVRAVCLGALSGVAGLVAWAGAFILFGIDLYRYGDNVSLVAVFASAAGVFVLSYAMVEENEVLIGVAVALGIVGVSSTVVDIVAADSFATFVGGPLGWEQVFSSGMFCATALGYAILAASSIKVSSVWEWLNRRDE